MNQKGLCSGLCSKEAIIDNSLLKRLMRKRKYSEAVVWLGSPSTAYDMQLFPLVTHSLYVRRRVEAIYAKGSKDDSQIIVKVPDCPGDRRLFKIVEDFCYDLMDDKDISFSNVRKVMATSNYLEMEGLTCRVWKFLEKYVYISFHSCRYVLATFEDYRSGRDAKEDLLFEKCKNSLVNHIVVHKTVAEDSSNSDQRTSTRRCSVDCLVMVARSLPPVVADCIYQYCRNKQFGLACYYVVGDPENTNLATDRSCIQIPLCTHFRGEITSEDGMVARFYPVAGSSVHGVTWTEELSKLVPEWPRRTALILHIVKSMHLENDIKLPRRTICRSRLNWSFLCAVLVEATELRTMAGETAIARDLDKEILNLQRLVSRGLGGSTRWRFAESRLAESSLHDQLGTGNLECSDDSEEDEEEEAPQEAEDAVELEWSEESDLEVVRIFKFGTLLSVVSNFRELSSDDLTITSVGKILDACLLEHLKGKTFTVQQTLLIYEKFPNDARTSHVGMYYVFKDSLVKRALSPKEMLDVTKLFDYGKLSDEIVEKLFILCASCDPRLQKRFMEMERTAPKDKYKSEAELMKLRSELAVQTADIMKVQSDKEKREEELITLLMKVRTDKDNKEEELIRLRNELRVQTADINNVQNELSAQSMDLAKMTQDSLLANKNLEEVKHDLEEEKDKLSCQICYTRPRDTLSLPCMHFLYCSDCLRQHHKRSKSCPTCRASTTGVLKCILIV